MTHESAPAAFPHPTTASTPLGFKTDSHDFIVIHGAREHNLKNISLRIPKRKITVFTGVSGSGKSSLVFDTVAAESQRLLNETFPTFVQTFLPRYGRPDVDSISNLSAAIIVDQGRVGANSRSTVGSATDAAALLRLFFSRIGAPAVKDPAALSANDPAGMCPACQGLGRVTTIDIEALVDREKSLNGGAIRFPGFEVGTWFWNIFAHSGFFDNDKKIGDYSDEERTRLLELTGVKVKTGTINSTYEGLLPKLRRLYLGKDLAQLPAHTRAAVEKVVTQTACPTCHGARLNPAALACRVGGLNIRDCLALEVVRLAEFVRAQAAPAVAPLASSLAERLDQLDLIGLGYLSLDRETSTLSGGESQRIKMIRHLGSSLTEMVYIFDEPSVGLHPQDIHRLTEVLRRLRDKGNTVLVVEHRPSVIQIADHVVDVGPEAGARGGEIVYQGDLPGLLRAGTHTGRHLCRRIAPRANPRAASGHYEIARANLHNLRDISVRIPRGVLTAVTGVAGSGKSSLIRGVLPALHPEAVVVDQSLSAGSRRSSLATNLGLLDIIRKAFASANKVSASLFSANSAGACPTCHGLGVVFTELAHLDPVATTCETCNGRRFTDEVLAHTLRGKNIDEVLGLSVAEAREFFTERGVRPTLDTLDEVGLGYLKLGQTLDTLSGGERQRLKLAGRLGERSPGRLYILDEPTTGLHMRDVANLLRLLDLLVEQGASVIVIEHNLEVVAHADWVIDLGPGAGREGGRIMFEGTPRELAECAESITGKHLRELWLGASSSAAGEEIPTSSAG